MNVTTENLLIFTSYYVKLRKLSEQVKHIFYRNFTKIYQKELRLFSSHCSPLDRRGIRTRRGIRKKRMKNMHMHSLHYIIFLCIL